MESTKANECAEYLLICAIKIVREEHFSKSPNATEIDFMAELLIRYYKYDKAIVKALSKSMLEYVQTFETRQGKKEKPNANHSGNDQDGMQSGKEGSKSSNDGKDGILRDVGSSESGSHNPSESRSPSRDKNISSNGTHRGDSPETGRLETGNDNPNKVG